MPIPTLLDNKQQSEMVSTLIALTFHMFKQLGFSADEVVTILNPDNIRKAYEILEKREVKCLGPQMCPKSECRIHGVCVGK